MAFRRSFGYDSSYYYNPVTSHDNNNSMTSYFSNLDNPRQSHSSSQYLFPHNQLFSDYNNTLVNLVGDGCLPSNNVQNSHNYYLQSSICQNNLNYSEFNSNDEPYSKRHKPLYQSGLRESYSSLKNPRTSNQSGKSFGEKFKNSTLSPEKLSDLAKNGVAPKSGSNGFHCYFCDAFCNSLITVYSHIESPKHKRHEQEPNERLQGIDSKFAYKPGKITIDILKARREELKKLTDQEKSVYIDHCVYLKDGKGVDAYICEICGVQLSSLKVIPGHISCNKHITNYETRKAEIEANGDGKFKTSDGDKIFSLSDQLKLVKAPVIGLGELIEYINPETEDMPIYECTLCKVFSNSATIITHIVGFKHRANYIKKVLPNETLNLHERTRDTMFLASTKAKELEELEGRGKWTIKVEKPNIPSNVSVSPTKKVPLKEIIDYLGTEDYQKKAFLEYFVNFKIESELEAKKAVEVINLLIEALLKYKLNQFPPDMKNMLFQKLMSEGIKSSILDQEMLPFQASNKTTKDEKVTEIVTDLSNFD